MNPFGVALGRHAELPAVATPLNEGAAECSF